MSPDAVATEHHESQLAGSHHRAPTSQANSSTSLHAFVSVLLRHRRFILCLVFGLLFICLAYCLIAPNQYEAGASIALRAAPASTLNLGDANEANSAAFASGQIELETLANVFRSDHLAWAVIATQHLDQAPAFAGRFSRKFPGFQLASPNPEAQAWLLDRFQRRLNVRTVPRTLILQIRFRSHDPALSAAVVNALIHAYLQQESASRIQATAEAAGELSQQLAALKSRNDSDQNRLAAFQKANDLLDTPETTASGQPSDVQHTAALAAIDNLNRELAAATDERILREAEFRAALRGNPELVVASDPRSQMPEGNIAASMLKQLHARHSDLEQEASQLSTEHGPSFPRVVEIRTQLIDLDRQIAAQDAKLSGQFNQAWQTAADREKLLHRELQQGTALAMKQNAAAQKYAAMLQQANATQELYTRALARREEAGLTAGIRSSNIEIVDAARQPVKPVAPDLPVYLAITLFVSLWLAIGGAFLLESLYPAVRTALVLFCAAGACACIHAQAPTPSTSGLPTGVARIPQSTETKSQPNPKDAPAVWSTPNPSAPAADALNAIPVSSPIAAPLGPGDLLEVTESHTPEFRSTVHVSQAGDILLPLTGNVQVNGLTQDEAARAIEKSLYDQGMLLHPQVTVLVTAFAGHDVSILGEVARPGVYPYGVHHRLLDLVSAASGFSATAGSLVTITHRDTHQPPLAIVLHSAGESATANNPDLEPGDTVQIGREGLVYLIGDVIRPGGFPVDPSQHLTVLQALTLAWGPTQNAALTKALLIREQNGGRTVTTINLKRLLRGEDPDIAIRDRDILFVPDSTAKNLWNRTMESVVQSAAGVSIYAGLVYSQRF